MLLTVKEIPALPLHRFRKRSMLKVAMTAGTITSLHQPNGTGWQCKGVRRAQANLEAKQAPTVKEGKRFACC